jgi:hypothetical protein
MVRIVDSECEPLVFPDRIAVVSANLSATRMDTQPQEFAGAIRCRAHESPASPSVLAASGLDCAPARAP